MNVTVELAVGDETLTDSEVVAICVPPVPEPSKRVRLTVPELPVVNSNWIF